MKAYCRPNFLILGFTASLALAQEIEKYNPLTNTCLYESKRLAYDGSPREGTVESDLTLLNPGPGQVDPVTLQWVPNETLDKEMQVMEATLCSSQQSESLAGIQLKIGVPSDADSLRDLQVHGLSEEDGLGAVTCQTL